ncbi:MAG: glutamyl-tRNA reductase [Clostridiales bacterium]|nr:glutamyl-tRNA reductase [Clostridiales bacterium]
MGITMTGIDHNAAEIDIRMHFSCTKKYTEEFLLYLKELPDIEGCVLLSTCNRMELWVSFSEKWEGDLYEIFCAHRGLNPDLYREYFTSRREQDAVRHLFRLTAGLESRILGDEQIISQVRDALTFSRQLYTTDHVLETLFRQAVTAAKKVRTQVPLSFSDQSVVHAAIRNLKRQGMTFSGRNCLVIGNGAMGKLAASLLQSEGSFVTVTVRQYHSGMVDIPAGCSRIDYGRRMEIFPQCDYIFSATVSPNCTLTREAVAQALTKPVTLVDLAVPRDIEPTVSSLPGVRLFDVDSFREEAHSEAQKMAICEAQTILNAQMDDFFTWYHCMDVIPQIEELKQQMARDLSPRLRKELRKLPLDCDDRQYLTCEIEAAEKRAANKLLFGLRDNLDPQTFRKCLDCLTQLYL